MKTVTDTSTAIGIVTAGVLVVFAIYISKSGVGGFIDLKSFIIVVGGTFFLTTACFTLAEVWQAHGLVLKTIVYSSEEPQQAALGALEVAEVARKKGLLGLQKYDNLMQRDPFFRKGLQLIIDGFSVEEVELILAQQIASTLERHKKSVSILRKAAEISPAMGLIGTLIGLVQMLGNLTDPATIGPAMAVALLTTLYGAAMAYMVFIPLASKLERNSKDEAMIMNIYLESVASIGRKENPRRLEVMINSNLPAAQRIRYFT